MVPIAGINIKTVQNINAGTRSIVAETLSFDKEKKFVCLLFLFIKNFGYFFK
tara:strand:- start:1546 stop:1701 length:156 start_codon:yes stop_codon:yes gene_type:complete